MGYDTALIPKAFVYHKRRIDWHKFFTQVHKFGKARPILNHWFPKYSKFTFWFPTLFILGLDLALIFIFFKINFPIFAYLFYFGLIFINSLLETKNLKIAFYSIVATFIQFYGYGIGFFIAQFKINILKQIPEKAFPELFFRN
jgi:hypothetical protein